MLIKEHLIQIAQARQDNVGEVIGLIGRGLTSGEIQNVYAILEEAIKEGIFPENRRRPASAKQKAPMLQTSGL